MAKARIYQPCKTAMQSGRGKTVQWLLEYAPVERQPTDPLIGWVGSGDPFRQLRLKFATCEAAVAYATAQGLDFAVEQPQQRKWVPNTYADNFAFSKLS